MAEEDVGQNRPSTLTGDAKRDYLVAYLADVILVAKAAEAKKVADQKEFKRRLAFIRNKLLMETLLQAEGKAAVTDAGDAARSTTRRSSRWRSEQEVRARHILVATEDGGQGDPRRAQEGRRLRRARQAEVEGPGRRGAKAAISATSPRTRWCRNSPRSPSSSTRARCPTR